MKLRVVFVFVSVVGEMDGKVVVGLFLAFTSASAQCPGPEAGPLTCEECTSYTYSCGFGGGSTCYCEMETCGVCDTGSWGSGDDSPDQDNRCATCISNPGSDIYVRSHTNESPSRCSSCVAMQHGHQMITRRMCARVCARMCADRHHRSMPSTQFRLRFLYQSRKQ